MKTWYFGVSVCFGKGDYGDTYVEQEVTDEQFEILTFMLDNDLTMEDGLDPVDEMLKDFDLAKAKFRELYDSVYQLACQQVDQETREFTPEWFDEHPNEKPSELYSISIHVEANN